MRRFRRRKSGRGRIEGKPELSTAFAQVHPATGSLRAFPAAGPTRRNLPFAFLSSDIPEVLQRPRPIASTRFSIAIPDDVSKRIAFVPGQLCVIETIGRKWPAETVVPKTVRIPMMSPRRSKIRRSKMMSPRRSPEPGDPGVATHNADLTDVLERMVAGQTKIHHFMNFCHDLGKPPANAPHNFWTTLTAFRSHPFLLSCPPDARGNERSGSTMRCRAGRGVCFTIRMSPK